MLDVASSLGLTTRFAWILQGASSGPDATFDEDLAQFSEAAVIPTLGSIIPEWLLVVPRSPCLSVAELRSQMRARLLSIADTAGTLMASLNVAPVVFEHGAGRPSTQAGCGVDQAHLHVIGGASDLLDRLAARVDETTWSTVDRADPWAAVPPGSDYLLIRDRSQAVLAIVDNPVSQRLRRAFADVVGRGSEWDYRSHPNAANARRAKEMFRGAFPEAA